MNTTEVRTILKDVLKHLFNLPEAVRFDITDEAFEHCARKLERLFPTPIFSDWEKSPFRLDEPLSPEERRLMELLLSPHGKTIYKALCHQKGVEP